MRVIEETSVCNFSGVGVVSVGGRALRHLRHLRLVNGQATPQARLKKIADLVCRNRGGLCFRWFILTQNGLWPGTEHSEKL